MIYSSVKAIRESATQVVTLAQVWAVGDHADYVTNYVNQTDYLNGSQLGNTIYGSAAYPGVAETSETHQITSSSGFGGYQVNMQMNSYDACDGFWMPPYLNCVTPGTTPCTGQASAQLTASAPYISGDSRVWLEDYGGAYHEGTVMTAYAGGAPETPVWTITGPFSAMVSASCTSCASVAVLPTLAASPFCLSDEQGIYIQYSVGGLTSPQVGLMIGAVWLEGATDPNPPYEEYENTAWGSGYMSYNWFKLTDNCGTPMASVPVSEAFPSGFTADYSGENWPTPVPNSSTNQPNGDFVDKTGEDCTGCTPLPQNSQSPLGQTLIYDGAWQVLDNGNATGGETFDQEHFQDHGLDQRTIRRRGGGGR